MKAPTPRRAVYAVLAVLAVLVLSVRVAGAFTILGPLGNNQATTADRKLATDAPPFEHWDLREFPTCVIPWSAHDGTQDIGGEFAEIESAFLEWEKVDNAIVRFNKVALPAGAKCPLLMDGNNTFGWDDDDGGGGAGCGMPSDDTWDPGIPGAQQMCGGAVTAGGVIVSTGPDGWLLSGPVNGCCDDDAGSIGPTPAIGAGPDGIIHTIPVGDDTWLPAVPVTERMCGGVVNPGSGIILDGGDGNLSPLNNCCDDTLDGAGNIVDGGDGIIHSLRSDGALAANQLALTAVFHDTSSGKILESDVLFNDHSLSFAWIKVDDGIAMGDDADVWTIAMHEIGHFLGIHHAAGAEANPPGPIMNVAFDLAKNSNHLLHDDDKDALNWLYTPDLGDAKDPDAGFNKYQSLVHGKIKSRKLNDVQLFWPAAGPYHLFGWKGADPANADFEFEWLGSEMDNSNVECEARVENKDDFDDGVTIPKPLARGAPNPIKIVVTTSGEAGRYDVSIREKRLYVSGYMDFNNDRVFTAFPDLVLWWKGTPEPEGGDAAKCTTFLTSPNFVPPAVRAGDTCTLNFDVDVPEDAPEDSFYCRFRLDYGEDESIVQNISGNLAPAVGAAQFGEVEDYLCELPHLPHRIEMGFTAIESRYAITTVALENHAFAGARVTDLKPITTTQQATLEFQGNLGSGTLGPLHGSGPLTHKILPVSGNLRLCWFLPHCGLQVDVPLTVNGTRGIGIGGLVTGTASGVQVSILGAPWTIQTASVTNVMSSSSGIYSLFTPGFGWGTTFLHGPASTTLTGVTGSIKLVTPIRVETNLGTPPVGGFATLSVVFVPEPGGWLLLGPGVLALVGLGRRRMKR